MALRAWSSGTAALEQPELVQRVAARQLVAVGIDARGDDVAVHGWEAGSGRSPVDVAAQFADVGVDALVVTEISRDGTMDGADVAGLRSVLEVAGCEVIASGGSGRSTTCERCARCRPTAGHWAG